MAVTTGTIAMYMVELNVEAMKVTNLNDAFWWSIVTVTTFGYGDIYPVTTVGTLLFNSRGQSD